MDAEDANGNVQHWIVEAQNTVSMRAMRLEAGYVQSPGTSSAWTSTKPRIGRPIGSTLAGSSPTSAKRRIIINGKQIPVRMPG